MTASQGRAAAFFDLDKTVIARSSTAAFTRPFHAEGLISRVAMLRSAYAFFFFHASGADHEQMEKMRQYVSRLTIGWDVQQVRDVVADALTELISPLVYAEAVALIAEHHGAGRDVILVSASGVEVVEPIGAMLGVDAVIATRMAIDAAGRYSGEIDFYAYGDNKAVAMRELAEHAGYDLADSYAYSDSATDLPMLAAVGHPFAVNPDRSLRREAARRQWPVLDFHRSEALGTRFPSRSAARAVAAGRNMASSRPAAGGMAVAIGAGAAAGIVWLANRRRTAV